MYNPRRFGTRMIYCNALRVSLRHEYRGRVIERRCHYNTIYPSATTTWFPGMINESKYDVSPGREKKKIQNKKEEK